jgi:hypothetical protein
MEVGSECISAEPGTMGVRVGFVREQEGGRLKASFARVGGSPPTGELPERDQPFCERPSMPYPCKQEERCKRRCREIRIGALQGSVDADGILQASARLVRGGGAVVIL